MMKGQYNKQCDVEFDYLLFYFIKSPTSSSAYQVKMRTIQLYFRTVENFT